MSSDSRKPTGSEPPADIAVLIGFVGDDPTVLGDILRAFRTSSEETTRELEDAMIAGSFAVIANCAHRVIAGARTIGALRLSHICDQIELTAAAECPTALPALFARFEKELNEIYGFLDARTTS